MKLKMSKKQTDPDAERFYRNFPTFPGIAKCVELLKRRNVQGGYLEIVLYEIRIHAQEHLDELVTEIRNNDTHIAALLLHELGRARLPEAEEFFIENLQSHDRDRRFWAIIGLKELDTKSARQALWRARSYEFDTQEATEEFRSTIDREMDWADGQRR